jgi:hypothetical protein
MDACVYQGRGGGTRLLSHSRMGIEDGCEAPVVFRQRGKAHVVFRQRGMVPRAWHTLSLDNTARRTLSLDNAAGKTCIVRDSVMCSRQQADSSIIAFQSENRRRPMIGTRCL